MIEIPDYEIKKEIGKGGMATVYLAIHQRLQREIALKVMDPVNASPKVFQDSFLSEGRIIAKLDHPNIVKIYDIDTQNGQFYMSMELLRNGSLKQHLSDEKLSLPSVLDIINQLADALGYAHKKGYIHRDIKPANIMFREDESVVLTDFGIAKMEGTLSEMTKVGYISGTPHYMSPEHSMGSDKIDYRSDIYSLGIVFYEMLTGAKPFVADNRIAIAYAHVHSSIPELEGENKVFQSALNKALAKKPEQRFSAIQDFSKALYEASLLTLTVASDVAASNLTHPKRMIFPWFIVATIAFSVIIGGYYYVNTGKKDTVTDTDAKEVELNIAKQNQLEAKRKEAELKAAQKKQLVAERKEVELKIAQKKQLEVERKEAELKAAQQKQLEADRKEAELKIAQQKELEAEREEAELKAAQQKQLEADRKEAELKAAQQKQLEADRKEAKLKAAQQKQLEAEKKEIELKAKQDADRVKKELALAAERKEIEREKINNHLSLAKIQYEKRRIFDHSNWSKGCKHYLEDVDGPYDPKETSEWHYQQILSMDAKNRLAQKGMKTMSKRKILEFSNCDNYQRKIKDDPLKGLFDD